MKSTEMNDLLLITAILGEKFNDLERQKKVVVNLMDQVTAKIVKERTEKVLKDGFF